MIDLAQIPGPIELEGEVCVIGAGAAGISLTRRLLKLGHTVVLLESGGLDYEPATADLNAGETVGEEYYDLEDSRLRFFGGTTAIWGGRCAELDPIDLERRDYVPHSGWPIGWEELGAGTTRRGPLFGLPARPAGARRRSARAGVRLPRFDRARDSALDLRPPLQPLRLGELRATSRPIRRCQIVIHATVTAIVRRRTAGSPGSRRARSAPARLTVRAKAFVLAAGGIENPRLLLASGLGNDHDQVGRYFMEHPHARGGRIVRGAAWPLLKAFGRRHRIGGQDLAALIAPSEALQRREGILNTSLTIVARQPQGAPAVHRDEGLFRRSSTAWRRPGAAGRCGWRPRRPRAGPSATSIRRGPGCSTRSASSTSPCWCAASRRPIRTAG